MSTKRQQRGKFLHKNWTSRQVNDEFTRHSVVTLLSTALSRKGYTRFHFGINYLLAACPEQWICRRRCCAIIWWRTVTPFDEPSTRVLRTQTPKSPLPKVQSCQNKVFISHFCCGLMGQAFTLIIFFLFLFFLLILFLIWFSGFWIRLLLYVSLGNNHNYRSRYTEATSATSLLVHRTPTATI